MQYDLTWFINPKPPKYYDALALEHGYTRGSATATELHITVQEPPDTAIIVHELLTPCVEGPPDDCSEQDVQGVAQSSRNG